MAGLLIGHIFIFSPVLVIDWMVLRCNVVCVGPMSTKDVQK